MADLKDKREKAEQLVCELPTEIEQANRELLVECMRVCYQELMDNTHEIEAINEWVKATRERLKDEILKKQGMEGQSGGKRNWRIIQLFTELGQIWSRLHG